MIMSDDNSKLCPLCNGALVTRQSDKGTFIGCSNYPKCSYVRHSSTGLKLLKMLQKACPSCSSPLALLSGKFGIFIACSRYPGCNYVYKNQDLAQISCPICTDGFLQKRNSKNGKIFYGCSNYPKCTFKIQGKPIEQQCSICGFMLKYQRLSKQGSKILCANSMCQSIKVKKKAHKTISLIEGFDI